MYVTDFITSYEYNSHGLETFVKQISLDPVIRFCSDSSNSLRLHRYLL